MSRNHVFGALVLVTVAGASSAFAQLGASPVQRWEQTSTGLGIPLQSDARFGTALAAGDFDGDGEEDLAIGIPGYDLEGLPDAGLVLVLYGSPDGPASAGNDLWAQNSVQLLDSAEENDRFGESLAAGDFDGDGYDDLAIGIPYESVGASPSAGAVQVLYGSSTGLTPVDQLFFHQGWDGGAVLGTAEELDRFGTTLATGDFDADGYDDLVVGVPYESISGQVGAGAFHVLFGAASGVSTVGDRLFYLGNGLPRVPGEGENLGWSLAAGDFDPGSAGDELAVGAPGTTVAGQLDAGVVWMVADLDGATTASPIDLADVGGLDEPELGDQLGCALAAGQFDGVGPIDLAIGACRRTVDGVGDAGKIYVDYRGTRPAVSFDQDGLPDEQVEASDFFGIVLASGDFDGDGTDDLVVGVPFEDLPGADTAGVVHVLPGVRNSGLTKTGASTLGPAQDPAEYDDRFGQSLVSGRFSGHSGADLAIGIPHESFAMSELEGAVEVRFSVVLFRDDFESGNTTAWGLAVP